MWSAACVCAATAKTDGRCAWTNLGLRKRPAPRRIKRRAIHIQMKCMSVVKSSQVLFILIIWKAAGSGEKDGVKKRDILLDKCQEERRTKAGKEDNEITVRKNQLQTRLCALLLRFINMNVLMKIDEHHQRDAQDFVQNWSWIMLMSSQGGDPEECGEISRIEMNLNKNRCTLGPVHGGFTARQ